MEGGIKTSLVTVTVAYSPMIKIWKWGPGTVTESGEHAPL